MTEFELAMIEELKGIKEALTVATNVQTDEQKLLSKYYSYRELEAFMDDEDTSQDLKDSLSLELNNLYSEDA